MKYKLKVMDVDAVQFLGVSDGKPVWDFADGPGPDWLTEAEQTERIRLHPVWPESRLQVILQPNGENGCGEMTAIVDKGYFVLRGEGGQLSVLSEEALNAAYEPAE